ncbi:MAG: CRISPR-associated endonuclease Cas1 [Thermoanaerobacteraceae bacterium]|nr:CRISPR-associated endonuclease Cas1 [Thermoanaerobacteraceae bacterium]
MNIIVSNYGSFIGKKSERLVIKEKGKVVTEVPFHDVEQLTVDTPGASFSAAAVKECMEHGIQINFLTGTGKPYAKITSPHLTGTVVTRREQISAYTDSRGVFLAKAFVTGKIKNQINLLKYFSKYRKSDQTGLYKLLLDSIAAMDAKLSQVKEVKGDCIDTVRGRLLSIEGQAANIYWEAVRELLAGKVEFAGRKHRGASDLINSLLNYGYGMLYNQVWSAVLLAGLEPFAGFMHVDRPGKPSLVLDLIEEFRQPVVDRVVIAAVNKGKSFTLADNQLDDKTRKELAAKVLERFEGKERYLGRQYKIKTIIQMQARRLATYLRKEGNYKPFVSRW